MSGEPPSTDDGIFDDYPDVDSKSCRLLGPTALIVQGLLGLLVILSLVYKRHRESPKRPWRIWLFDVAKQLCGQMFVHGINLLISDVVARISSGNRCVFYFLNILIDTTLGVGLIYFLLKSFNHILIERFNLEGFVSGQYGTPPQPSYWLRQTAVYVLCLTFMKLVVVALFALWPGVFKIGEWMLSWLGDGDVAQVIFVMGLFPIIMNILQFWLIDSIVKASEQPGSLALPDSRTSQDREPLFQASDSDDEDDSTIGRPKYDIENPAPPSESRNIVTPLLAGTLTPDTKSVSMASGSTTPLEAGDDDVKLRRYTSTSPTIRTTAPPPATDEWAWDDPAEQAWDDDTTAWRDKDDGEIIGSAGINPNGKTPIKI